MTVQQAGGLVVRRAGDEYECLLVTSKRDPTVWVLPKGHIERDELAHEAALREVREEAGVDGELVEQIGEVNFTLDTREVTVTFFLIRFRDHVPASEGRRLRWCAYDEALTTVQFEGTREIIRRAFARLSAAPSI